MVAKGIFNYGSKVVKATWLALRACARMRREVTAQNNLLMEVIL